MANTNGQVTLLPTKTITTALTGWVTDTFRFGNAFPKVLTVHASFAYGSGGTTAKAWIQTSFDSGATWIDVMCFAFATTTAQKVAQVGNFASTAVVTPTDATLADNTVVGGILGPMLRVKITTTGTYAGGTTLTLQAQVR